MTRPVPRHLLVLLVLLSAIPSVHAQTLRGDVLDRATGVSLPGAHVIVPGSDPLIGTTTDLDGRFTLTALPLGRIDLLIRYVGYEDRLVTDVLVVAGDVASITVLMDFSVFEAEGVTVTPDVRKDVPLNDMALLSARAFSVEDTRRYASGLDDPARMASVFPGVSAGAGVQHNAISIRGNSPRGVRWHLEGVEIPNPSHFAGLSVLGGGGLTLFSGRMLADSDFLTGAFPAEYGNALAGVFDMSFRTGNPDRHNFRFQAGVLGLEGAAEGPFRRGKQSSFLINYRYSTLGLVLPLLPTEDAIRYQDLSFKFNFPTRHMGRFEAWGMAGLDHQKGTPERDPDAWEYVRWDLMDTRLDLANGSVGLSHTYLLGGFTVVRTAVASTLLSTDWVQRRLDGSLLLQDDVELDDRQRTDILQTHVSTRLGSRLSTQLGVDISRTVSDQRIESADSVGSPLLLRTSVDDTAHRQRAFGQLRWQAGQRFAVTGGMNVQHDATSDQLLPEPRLSVRWESGLAGNWSAAYGRHSQFEDTRFVHVLLPDGSRPNATLEASRSHHAVMGWDRPLGASTRLHAEFWSQWLSDLPVVPGGSVALINFEQEFTFAEPLVNAGRGRNPGVDVTLERYPTDGFYYLATASLFSSRYRGGDGVWRDTRFNRRLAVNVLSGREWTVSDRDLLSLNVRAGFSGGRPRTPFDQDVSRELGRVVYDETRAFTERDPHLVLVDLSVSWRRNHARRTDVWALQIKNLAAAKEITPDIHLIRDRVENVREGFPLPVLSYSVSF